MNDDDDRNWLDIAQDFGAWLFMWYVPIFVIAVIVWTIHRC